jgi:filamentous hemagglutinin family protein
LLIIFDGLARQNIPLSQEMKEKINNISMQFEAVEHGNPSGIDNYISVNGGVILYNKTK